MENATSRKGSKCVPLKGEYPKHCGSTILISHLGIALPGRGRGHGRGGREEGREAMKRRSCIDITNNLISKRKKSPTRGG